MLLEAWRITQALSKAGVELGARSSDVATPGLTGGPVIRLVIGSDLSFDAIPVPEDELSTLWSFRQGNFHFWPVLRPDQPLCANAESAASWRRRLAAARSEKNRKLREAAVAVVLAEGASADVCYLDALRDLEQAERESHKGKFARSIGLSREVRILRYRLDRFLRKAQPLEEVLPGLREAVFALLYGREEKGKVRGFGQVAFDLKEESIYRPQIRSAIEAQLASGGSHSGMPTVCELAGTEGNLHRGKFPNPTLPVVANSGIAMMSMFRDAHANFRYGRADDEIVRINRETVQAAHDAIVHVTASANRGIHWRPFPNGKTRKGTEQSDLLISYAEGTGLARVYDEDDEPDGPTYEEVIAPVLEALDGKAKLTPKATVMLILLRQISNAQVQSVYCRTPLATEVLEAGRRWVGGQRNRPPLLCESKERLISPAEVVRLLSKQWLGRPPKATKLDGPSGGETLDFMLAHGTVRRERASDLLRLFTPRSEALLLFVGAESRRDPNPKAGDAKKRAVLEREADRMARLLALLLDGKERTMEDTTRSPAYLLGLLLGLVDTLHWAYCVKVRKDVPPSLGGGQLLGIASDDPVRALAELLERVRPWHDWADTAAPTGDDDRATLRAKKALARLSAVAPELAGRLPVGLDDTGRAELLLGYLSRDAVADQYATAAEQGK